MKKNYPQPQPKNFKFLIYGPIFMKIEMQHLIGIVMVICVGNFNLEPQVFLDWPKKAQCCAQRLYNNTVLPLFSD